MLVNLRRCWCFHQQRLNIIGMPALETCLPQAGVVGENTNKGVDLQLFFLTNT